LGDLGGQKKTTLKQNSENNAKNPKWLTANNQFYARYKNKRAELKNNMTEAELKLWDHLKNKKLGVKFRRQHVIDFYIPDFVALSIKLIVEVDGKIHLKQKKEDSERTKRLEILGYKIIRFTNDEIENDITKVLNKIKMNIELRKSN
jgi:very-short-patch-repair endonuclease